MKQEGASRRRGDKAKAPHDGPPPAPPDVEMQEEAAAAAAAAETAGERQPQRELDAITLEGEGATAERGSPQRGLGREVSGGGEGDRGRLGRASVRGPCRRGRLGGSGGLWGALGVSGEPWGVLVEEGEGGLYVGRGVGKGEWRGGTMGKRRGSCEGGRGGRSVWGEPSERPCEARGEPQKGCGGTLRGCRGGVRGRDLWRGLPRRPAPSRAGHRGGSRRWG